MQKYAWIRCQNGPKWQIREIKFSRKLSVLEIIKIGHWNISYDMENDTDLAQRPLKLTSHNIEIDIT